MCPIKMEACRQRETDKQEMEAPDAKKAERDCRVTAVDQARRTEPAGKRGSGGLCGACLRLGGGLCGACLLKEFRQLVTSLKSN